MNGDEELAKVEQIVSRLRPQMTEEHKAKMADGRARAAAERAAAVVDDEQVVDDAKATVAAILGESKPDVLELGPLARALAIKLFSRALTDKTKVTNARDLKPLAELAVNVARLESGQATTITGKVDREEVTAQIIALRDKAKPKTA